MVGVSSSSSPLVLKKHACECGKKEGKRGRKKLSKKIVSANAKSCVDFFSSEVQFKTLARNSNNHFLSQVLGTVQHGNGH
jgi:hypothetical protein